MATHHSDDLTVVIPTYNRKKYLRRALHYWGRTAFKVIVADGSEEMFAGEMPSNVRYFHDSTVAIDVRWHRALQEVHTPYVVLCGDDDFLSCNGICECINFLDSHADYVSAQGHAIEFEMDDRGQITVSILNAERIGHRIDAKSARGRLRQLFNKYVYQIYSVYRTPMLQLVFETCLHQKNGTYTELAAAIVPSIFGKHMVLPVFFSARENLPGAGSSTIECARFDILNTEGMRDYTQWRDKLARIYADAEGVPAGVALAVIEDTFARYIAWDLRVSPHRRPLHEQREMEECPAAIGTFTAPVSIRQVVKRLVPSPLLRARRSVLERLRLESNPSDVLTKAPGFPWSDADAAIEWQGMVDTMTPR